MVLLPRGGRLLLILYHLSPLFGKNSSVFQVIVHRKHKTQLDDTHGTIMGRLYYSWFSSAHDRRGILYTFGDAGRVPETAVPLCYLSFSLLPELFVKLMVLLPPPGCGRLGY